MYKGANFEQIWAGVQLQNGFKLDKWIKEITGIKLGVQLGKRASVLLGDEVPLKRKALEDSLSEDDTSDESGTTKTPRVKKVSFSIEDEVSFDESDDEDEDDQEAEISEDPDISESEEDDIPNEDVKDDEESEIFNDPDFQNMSDSDGDDLPLFENVETDDEDEEKEDDSVEETEAEKRTREMDTKANEYLANAMKNIKTRSSEVDDEFFKLSVTTKETHVRPGKSKFSLAEIYEKEYLQQQGKLSQEKEKSVYLTRMIWKSLGSRRYSKAEETLLAPQEIADKSKNCELGKMKEQIPTKERAKEEETCSKAQSRKTRKYNLSFMDSGIPLGTTTSLDGNAMIVTSHLDMSDDEDEEMLLSPESETYDDQNMMDQINDEIASQLASAGPTGVAAAAAISSTKRRKRSHTFETNPSIRKRQQTRLLRKLKTNIEEFSLRVGQQAVILIATPGKQQKLSIVEGIPTPVEKMTQAQLRAFIPLMLKYSTGRGKPGWGKDATKPVWWPDGVPWANVRMDARKEDDKQKVSWTHALRQIVINCYKYHGRDDLLPSFDGEDDNNEEDKNDIDEERLVTTNTTASSMMNQYSTTMVQTISNSDGTVSIIQVDPSNPVIALPDGSTAQVQTVTQIDQNQLRLHSTKNEGSPSGETEETHTIELTTHAFR
ncbi:NRF1 [Lepeophtheirus salmonis]|uniref:NRF1 n=1 Tax=Lepeophtheirus salmonis TaxID=72036 RepID=A0A7R8HA86_LEPSM|nr:NRF1 [Lepeophtheirus salmonis]CAF2953035.1 NRF1 [Lepeophtheirus salmonis]